MSRSSLTIKYKLDTICKFEKSFKEHYKSNNEKPFKGNVIQYVTLGVIQRKKIPDISDCITLIKLGNMDCSDEQAQGILDRWLEDENNKELGVVGAFICLCKDLCLDIPFNKQFVEQVENMENTINEMQNMIDTLSKMINQLGNLSNANNENNEMGVTEEITQD